ncbi:MAG TPA: GYD domain-containing protein [Planctomycetaceae bacterium]|nr:GYD domain-containing protein [Planctomycetaceae bacterium]
MATFVSTIKFTEQGIKTISETTKRASAFEAAAKKMGAKVSNIFWTLGAFDGVLVFDAPDDETASALLLHLGTSGNVQTTTARAFNAAEMGKIVSKLSK